MNLSQLSYLFQRVYSPPKRGWHSKKRRQFKKSHKKYFDLTTLVNSPNPFLDLVKKDSAFGKFYIQPIVFYGDNDVP